MSELDQAMAEKVETYMVWHDTVLEQIARLHDTSHRHWDATDRGEVFAILSRRLRADAQFLIIAACHALTAVDQILGAPATNSVVERAGGAEFRPTIQALRNVMEHWDEQLPAFDADRELLRRSGLDFAKMHPDAHPWSLHTVGGRADVVGGVVRVGTIAGAVLSLRTAVAEHLGEDSIGVVKADLIK